jgi:serine-type D-Ala-D-Ala carboxypeptidase/endopeptidase
MRRRAYLAVLALVAACAGPLPYTPSPFPSDPQVAAMLDHVVGCDTEVGIVVGILEADAMPRVVACGGTGIGNAKADGGSIFEIGSLTKVFTGTLLADMAARGEVQLSDPIERYLPPGVHMPGPPWRAITLLDVATHTASLPRDPPNLGNTPRAYASYTTEDLYAFLSTYSLPRDPGSRDEYSNLFALVGHALSQRAGRPYEALLRERVLAPLGLVATGTLVRKDTAGHEELGDERSDFVVPALEPATGLRSSVNDLLRFAAANMRDGDAPIDRALRDARVPQRPMGGTGRYWGLGWGVEPQSGAVGHQGATFGYASYLHVDPRRHRAIVVLANFTGTAVSGIGTWLLEPSRHALPAPSLRRAVYLAWRRAGADAALERFQALGGTEQDLNVVAYRALVQGQADAAIAMFAFNAREHPESPNVHDSLAEAYLVAGRVSDAVESCTRAVDMAEQQHDPRLTVFQRQCEAAKARLGTNH